MLWTISSVALGFQPPNSLLGVSVGATPGGPGLGGRGELWLADEVSLELGATADLDLAGWTADLAARWRPDRLCFGCDRRALATFGAGIAGFTRPDFGFDDPWPWAAGLDLVGTFVYWVGPNQGLAVSLRGGGGAQVLGDDLDTVAPAGWGFATVGLAF